jgi:hypothetical protein
MGHDGFEYRNRREILGQPTGNGLEFYKIQSENCLPGREFLASKEMKRVYLSILPTSAIDCPTHDLYGFYYEKPQGLTESGAGYGRKSVARFGFFPPTLGKSTLESTADHKKIAVISHT